MRVEAGTEFVAGTAIVEMARAAEAAGFHAVFATDHPAPDDRWLAAGGHHALEPLVALAAAAAATTRVRVHTHVYVAAYRSPFLAAKSVTTLDVVSGGRVILGVAAGYLRPEFGALGVDFDERNDLLDETLDVMIRAWTERGVALEGRHVRARGVTQEPRPVQVPHPPLWIGGNSRRAVRRAVAVGQGWAPFPTSPELAHGAKTAAITSAADLAARVAELRAAEEVAGRAQPMDVCFAPVRHHDVDARRASSARGLLDEVEELAAAGATWLTVRVGGSTRTEWCDGVAALGDALGL